MKRLLSITMALGLVISAMNFTGIFAIFSDRATTGTNSAESGAQPRIADLQVSTTLALDCSDASYTDDLETGLIAVTDLVPGEGSTQSVLCLKNAGTSDLNLSISVIDVVDTETGCTGDEAAAGDATCGTAGIGDGELSTALIQTVSRLDCALSTTELAISPYFAELIDTPTALGTLASGEVTCVWLRVQMTAPGQGGATLESIQQAQSDKVEWRFAFDGLPV